MSQESPEGELYVPLNSILPNRVGIYRRNIHQWGKENSASFTVIAFEISIALFLIAFVFSIWSYLHPYSASQNPTAQPPPPDSISKPKQNSDVATTVAPTAPASIPRRSENSDTLPLPRLVDEWAKPIEEWANSGVYGDPSLLEKLITADVNSPTMSEGDKRKIQAAQIILNASRSKEIPAIRLLPIYIDVSINSQFDEYIKSKVTEILSHYRFKITDDEKHSAFTFNLTGTTSDLPDERTNAGPLRIVKESKVKSIAQYGYGDGDKEFFVSTAFAQLKAPDSFATELGLCADLKAALVASQEFVRHVVPQAIARNVSLPEEKCPSGAITDR